MTQFIEYQFENGRSLLVEAIDETDGGQQPVGRGERIVRRAGSTLGDSLAVLDPFFDELWKTIAASSRPPKSVDVEVNVGFSIGGTIHVLSGSADGSMTLRFTWELP